MSEQNEAFMIGPVPADIESKFNQRMAAFLASPEGTVQDQSVNRQATKDVCDAIGVYPRKPNGADWIIADLLMHQFDCKPYTKTPYDERPATAPVIGIREMAQIVPDPNEAAEEIDKIHTNFNLIQRLGPVPPVKACGMTCAFAARSLDSIRTVTLAKANEVGLSIPPLLTRKVRKREQTGEGVGPWEIDRAVAFELYEFLKRNPDNIRTKVAKEVEVRADAIRGASRDHIREAIHAVRFEEGRPIK